jgi:hypothetical protein
MDARVTRSEAPTLLEDQEGRTFSRHVPYSLSPSLVGTSVRVKDDAKLQGPRQGGLVYAAPRRVGVR